MNYCENCRFVSEQAGCPVCGSKKLREVRDDDFCFLADSCMSPCETLVDILNENGIQYSAVPYGTGSRLALSLSHYRLYVPYRFFERAKSILNGIENAETERLRKILLENQNKIHIDPKKERKIAKKLKISEEQDFYLHCVHIIESSEKIVDEGVISVCPKRGHYLFCYSDEATICINSQTYEILSLKTS